jgi:hypothetical protein
MHAIEELTVSTDCFLSSPQNPLGIPENAIIRLDTESIISDAEMKAFLMEHSLTEIEGSFVDRIDSIVLDGGKIMPLLTGRLFFYKWGIMENSPFKITGIEP